MHKYTLIILFICSIFTNCTRNEATSFPQTSLLEEVESIEGAKTTIGSIIDSHKGEYLIIEIWASWCPDCIKSMPKLAKFQTKHPEVAFAFISVDDKGDAWERGVERYVPKFNLKGDHYRFPTGWDRSGSNQFIDFIGLDWIPRYILVDKNSNIEVFYSKTLDDKKISKNLP